VALKVGSFKKKYHTPVPAMMMLIAINKIFFINLFCKATALGTEAVSEVLQLY
jgi:hypothetical protein